MNPPNVLLRVLSSLFILGSAACAGDALQPNPSLAPITVQASSADSAVAGITVEVSAADISESLLVNLSYDSGTDKWQGQLEVPAGTGRTFVGKAYDSTGALTHEGSITADVVAGANSTIGLTLNPIEELGTVPIDVTVANRLVSISPLSDSVTVGVAASFTATVEGSDCTPTWALSNPGVASFGSDPNGTTSASVQGNGTGSTKVVVNCGGIAAAARLTIN